MNILGILPWRWAIIKAYTFPPNGVLLNSCQALCHCLACRKISGGTSTFTLAIPKDNYRVTSGTPKTYSVKQESGVVFDLSFCGDCGTMMSKEAQGDAFPGLKIVTAGTIDGKEGVESIKPGAELYLKHRVSWVPEIAVQARCRNFLEAAEDGSRILW